MLTAKVQRTENSDLYLHDNYACQHHLDEVLQRLKNIIGRSTVPGPTVISTYILKPFDSETIGG
jgi:hypothetical protein